MPYWKLYHHFVWGTKNRLPLIDSVIEPDLYHVIAVKAQNMGGFVRALGGTVDHAHLAVSIPPKLAPAKFTGDVKGNGSTMSSSLVSSSIGRMNMGCYLSVSGISLRWYDMFTTKNGHHTDGTLVAAMERMDER